MSVRKLPTPTGLVSVLAQVSLAFRSGSRRALIYSVPWGCALPISTYMQAHAVLAGNGFLPARVALAVGGLAWSGATLFEWMYSIARVSATRPVAVAKALGFVVLAEGTLVYPPEDRVGVGMLVLLCAANVIGLQCNMVLDRRQERAAARRKRRPVASVFKKRTATTTAAAQAA